MSLAYWYFAYYFLLLYDVFLSGNRHAKQDDAFLVLKKQVKSPLIFA